MTHSFPVEYWLHYKSPYVQFNLNCPMYMKNEVHFCKKVSFLPWQCRQSPFCFISFYPSCTLFPKTLIIICCSNHKFWLFIWIIWYSVCFKQIVFFPLSLKWVEGYVSSYRLIKVKWPKRKTYSSKSFMHVPKKKKIKSSRWVHPPLILKHASCSMFLGWVV